MQGKHYGLELNNSKLGVLVSNAEGMIYDELGNPIKRKDKIIYLGSVLSADGSVSSQVGR